MACSMAMLVTFGKKKEKKIACMVTINHATIYMYILVKKKPIKCVSRFFKVINWFLLLSTTFLIQVKFDVNNLIARSEFK